MALASVNPPGMHSDEHSPLKPRFRDLAPISLDLALPWLRSEKQEQRFKRILITCLMLMLLLLLVVAFSPETKREKEVEEKIVAKTKVILKPITVTPVVEPPKPKPKPTPVEPPKVVKTKAQSTSKTPKKTAINTPKSTGLAEVSSQLSALRNSFDLTRNQKKNLTSSNAGKKEKTSRNLLGKDSATKKSDGVKIDSDIQLDDRTTLAAHNTASVEGADRGGVEGGSPVSRYATHMSGERTMESIRYTLERNRGNIFALYHKALIDNPNLSGKYTFELRIEPDGRISNLTLVSSELNNQRLNDAILERIRPIVFKAEDVSPARLNYTFHFIEN